MSSAEKPLDESAERPNQEFSAFSMREAQELYSLDRRCLLSPWTFEGFRAELGHDYSHCWGRRNEQGGVDAFLLSHVILDEAHLLKIGVDAGVRQQGVGGRLLHYAISRYRELGVRFVYLEVRRSNQIARAFYRRFGFIENGERRNYYGKEEGYEQETEDAILYLRML